MTKSNQEQKLIDMLQDFDTAMLVTRSSSGALDARPMAVAECSDEGDLWFVTDRNSGKVADLILENEAAVTLQASSKYVSLSGKCHASDDKNRLNELWQESWKVWFPGGKSDPSILLLRFVPERGEYWDNSGFAGMKYLVKAGIAYLQGERAEVDERINATVSM